MKSNHPSSRIGQSATPAQRIPSTSYISISVGCDGFHGNLATRRRSTVLLQVVLYTKMAPPFQATNHKQSFAGPGSCWLCDEIDPALGTITCYICDLNQNPKLRTGEPKTPLKAALATLWRDT